MTPRAAEILRGCDIIAAEDTKNSMTLMTKFGIKAKLVSNHKFNEAGSAEFFINELLGGKNIAVISDAGTPCISDPGHILVKKAAENDIEVSAVPGACAVTAAFSLSGFEIKTFTFIGFFPREKNEAEKTVKKLAENPGVYIFYESPRRIIKTVGIFAGNFPDCEFCLCNDLTKKFEKIYRGGPEKILCELQSNPAAQKGEYTAVIKIPAVKEAAEKPEAPTIESLIADVMAKQKCTVKEAVKYIAGGGLYGKNEIYAASLNLKKMFGGEN
jgi:16S rRNA (cytidine1402-2'-O)-methyltransferase